MILSCKRLLVDIFLTRRLSKSLAFCEFVSVNFETWDNACSFNSSECDIMFSSAHFLQILDLYTLLILSSWRWIIELYCNQLPLVAPTAVTARFDFFEYWYVGLASVWKNCIMRRSIRQYISVFLFSWNQFLFLAHWFLACVSTVNETYNYNYIEKVCKFPLCVSWVLELLILFSMLEKVPKEPFVVISFLFKFSSTGWPQTAFFLNKRLLTPIWLLQAIW